MKKFCLFALLFVSASFAYAQEFMQITTIESVVPGGLGRSRMITQDANGKMEEVKMENFFSLVGINFENVRNNDRMITAKLTDMERTGWKLEHVTTGVYGVETSTGIFITRYLFKKEKSSIN
jgi:hypothetical protein